jgi:hypothetical protein
MALQDYLGGINIFGTPIPTGILDPQQEEKLRNQALVSGIIGTAANYLATPKNLNAGSALPYLAKAYIGGMGASQNTVDTALNNLYRQQLLANRSDNLYNVDGALIDKQGNVVYQSPTKQQERKTVVVDGVLVDANTGEKIYESTKQQKLNTDIIDVGGKKILINKDTGAPIQEYKVTGGGLGLKDIYGEPQKDVSGKLLYIPKIPGYPVRDMGGNIIQGDVKLPEKAEKAATESQAKAATFYSQMSNASDELRKLQAEGFDPSSPLAQTAVNLAGTPLRGLAGQQAQRAKQIQEQWAESFLRIKTGAAATKDEVRKNVETFFPRFGETDPNIIAQKERARAQAEQDVLRMTKEGGGSVGAKPKELSAQDKQALDWANANPTDPRSVQIKQKLGL